METNFFNVMWKNVKDFQPPKLSGLKVSAVVLLMKPDQSMFDLLRKLSNSSASKYKIMFFHGFFFFSSKQGSHRKKVDQGAKHRINV